MNGALVASLALLVATVCFGIAGALAAAGGGTILSAVMLAGAIICLYRAAWWITKL